MGRTSTLGDILSNFEIIFLQVHLALTVLLFSLNFFFLQFSKCKATSTSWRLEDLSQ